jgi:hypothetical protein
LELLGREFLALRAEKRALVSKECETLRRQYISSLPLNVIRLCALLEVDRPKAPHFCDSPNLPAGIEDKCIILLQRVNVKTVGRLRNAFKSGLVKRALRRYASLNGLSADTVPDLSAVLILVRLKNRALVATFFPEFIPEYQ